MHQNRPATADVPVPLSRYRAFRTSDPLDARAAAERLLSAHRMRLIDPATAFDAQVNSVSLGGVSLMFFSYRAAVEISAASLAGYVAVLLPLWGSAFVEYGGHRMLADGARSAVLSPGRPMSMRWSPGLGQLAIRVECDLIGRHLAALLGRPQPGALQFAPELDLHSEGLALRGVVLTARRVLEQTGRTGPSPMLQAELEHSIVSALLLGSRHSYTDALTADYKPASPRVISRVLDFIEAGYDQVLSAADLAAVAGVSERSLRAAFHRRFGIGPMAYVRRLRLECVRDELIVADPACGKTVTDVALRHGFTHTGRFAAAYRARYGESPSETLRR